MSRDTENRERLHLWSLYQESEWRRCRIDPEYFIGKYVHVTDRSTEARSGGLDLTGYQREDLQVFERYREVIVLKARQLGLSTLVAAYIIWKMCFNPGFSVIATSKDQRAANNNTEKVKAIFAKLPQFVKDRLKVTSETQSDFRFTHVTYAQSSVFTSLAMTDTVGASDTYDLAVLDEYALKPQHQVKTYGTIKPTVRIAMSAKKSAAMIIISTARGSHDMFAGIFKAAWAGKSSFKAIFHPWSVSKFMTQADYDNEYSILLEAGRPWEIYSEYPATVEEAFRESGQRLFADLPPDEVLTLFPYRGDVVEVAQIGGETAYFFEESDDGPLRLRDLDYDDAGNYYIGADVSLGEGGDAQAAVLLYIDPANPVAEVEFIGYYQANNVESMEYAAALDHIGRYFKGCQSAALLGVEQQGGYGTAVINELNNRLFYPNPYQHRNPSQRPGAKSAYSPFVFPMSQNMRGAALTQLKTYLLPRDPNNQVPGDTKLRTIPVALVSELRTFVKKVLPGGGIKYAADTGTHDDMVMSCAVGLWVTVSNYNVQTTETEGNVVQRDFIGELIAQHRERAMNPTPEDNELFVRTV